MDHRTSSGPFSSIALITACICSALLALAIFGHLKSIEGKFRKERAGLVRDKMELKDRLDSLKEEMKFKLSAIGSLEEEKRSMSAEIAELKKSAEALAVERDELKSLREENNKLKGEAGAFSGSSVAQFMKNALARETNPAIKRVLSDALARIETIAEGRSVSLEPIVVTQEDSYGSGAQGKALSIDARNNLAVIDLGSIHGVREGQRCSFFDAGEAICSGAVIRTRYKISAVTIDSFQAKHTIRDVKEGDKVSME